jgi:hypothetical protein
MGEADFQGFATENPLTDRSFVDAVTIFPLIQVTSPAVAMADMHPYFL